MFKSLTIAALACLIALPAAAGLVAVSNLDESTNYLPDVSASQMLAGSFTTGASATALESVTLLLRSDVGVPVNFSAALYSDTGSQPYGAGLDTEPDALMESMCCPEEFLYAYASRLVTYTSAGMPLAPKTKYWIVLQSDGPAGNWWGTASTAETSSLGWTIGDGYRTSQDQGATWGYGAPYVVMFSVTTGIPTAAAPTTWRGIKATYR